MGQTQNYWKDNSTSVSVIKANNKKKNSIWITNENPPKRFFNHGGLIKENWSTFPMIWIQVWENHCSKYRQEVKRKET